MRQRAGPGWFSSYGKPGRVGSVLRASRQERVRERGVCVLSAEREREREKAQICTGILGVANAIYQYHVIFLLGEHGEAIFVISQRDPDSH